MQAFAEFQMACQQSLQLAFQPPDPVSSVTADAGKLSLELTPRQP